MDSQLNPLPQPGGRPFYDRYVVQGDKKSLKETIEEVKAKSKCAILCTNPTKPKLNFISDEKIHYCSHVRPYLLKFYFDLLNFSFCHLYYRIETIYSVLSFIF